ncbi:MAG: biotin transporter BioY [Clostridia bacterium]|nr:biotin transporter BioY [Clostridia bacterium]
MKPKALKLTLTALFAVVIAVCSMLSIPAAVPFTLQTFGIFLAMFVLGGKYGTLSVAVYVCLGLVGLPVFHNFTAGIGVLMSGTGGYIIGFVLSGIVYMLITKIFGNKNSAKLTAAFTGLILCYITGTLWFVFTASQGNGFVPALLTCVVPYIIPDTLKILLAFFIAKRTAKLAR